MNQSSPDEADSAEELKVESTLVQRFPATNLQVLAHFYRGELARANVWRQRMDATTHWAVVSTMAIISLAYSNQEASVLLLPFCCVLLYLLLHIEARRYRYFDVWRMRVRMLEVHLMVPALLQGQDLAEGNWRETLCNDLLAPNYKMSRIEALGRRLQRTYIWLFLIVLGTWLLLGFNRADPVSGMNIRVFGQGPIPGMAVVGGMILFYLYLSVILIIAGPRQDTEIRRKEPSRQHWPI
ncbi:hypothetical protein CBD41_01855 [bacterium TMED181]|nr:hypothetical protein [Planctomycetota bacterium]OUW46949.1 MAG: hypothetical protein CBD41_01855 [bacterium TMED181]